MSHCVLLTRPEGSNDVLSQMLDQRGIRTLERPMLKIKSVPVNPAGKALVLDFNQFEAAIFVSKNAVPSGRFRRRIGWDRATDLSSGGGGTARLEAPLLSYFMRRSTITSDSLNRPLLLKWCSSTKQLYGRPLG